MVGKDGSNFIGYILKHWFMMILGICDPWCLPNTPSLTKIAYLQWPSPKITQQVLNPWANISAAVLISPCTDPHNSFGITKNQLNFMFIGFHRWFRLGSVEICRNPVDQKAQKATAIPISTRRSSLGVALMRSLEAWSPSSRTLGTTFSPGRGWNSHHNYAQRSEYCIIIIIE
jgi:hypothetical protein